MSLTLALLDGNLHDVRVHVSTAVRGRLRPWHREFQLVARRGLELGSTMKVAQLREACTKRGLPKRGRRAELTSRLEAWVDIHWAGPD